LSEAEIRELILSEYTFLKRPVIIKNNQIFVGNLKKTVEDAKKAFGK
jgi:arsenate reductase